uniref:Putative secreted protein n=1 Tax=Rhipicephalus microplus TaxID=6941 RepID=A0A6M2D9M9_RHIMP
MFHIPFSLFGLLSLFLPWTGDVFTLYSAPSLSIGTQAFCAPVGGAQHPDRVLLPSPPAVCGDTYWLHVCSFAIKPCGSFQNVRVFPLVLQTLYIWGRSAITVGFNV